MNNEQPQRPSSWHRLNALLIYLTLCGITGTLMGAPLLVATGSIDKALLAFLVSPLITFCVLPLYWITVGCAAAASGELLEIPSRAHVFIPFWMWSLAKNTEAPSIWKCGFVQTFLTLSKPRVRIAFAAIMIHLASIIVITSAMNTIAKTGGGQDQWITVAGFFCGVIVGTVITLPFKPNLLR